MESPREEGLRVLQASFSISKYPHEDKNLKSQALAAVKLALQSFDLALEYESVSARDWFNRGHARLFHLELAIPVQDYDTLLSEAVSDLLRAYEEFCKVPDPKDGPLLVLIAREYQLYSESLVRQLVQPNGQQLDKDSENKLNNAFQQTLVLASTPIVSDLPIEYQLILLNCKAVVYKFFHKVTECTTTLDQWLEKSRSLKEIPPTDWYPHRPESGIKAALHLKGTIEQEINQNNDAAFKSWDECLALDPLYDPVLISKVKLLRKLNNHSESVKLWTTILEVKPHVADFWYMSAADLEFCGKIDLAISHLEKALSIDGNHLFALNDLAFHYITAERWQEAHPLLEKVLMQGPNDDIPWINMANVLYHIDKQEQALKSIERSYFCHRVGGRPPSAEEHLIHAAILRKLDNQENKQESVSSEDGSKTEKPTSSTEALPKAGSRQSKIVKCFVNAIKAENKMERAQAYFEYADYLYSMGNDDQARTNLALAFKLAPNGTITSLNLTKIELCQNTIQNWNSITSRS